MWSVAGNISVKIKPLFCTGVHIAELVWMPTKGRTSLSSGIFCDPSPAPAPPSFLAGLYQTQWYLVRLHNVSAGALHLLHQLHHWGLHLHWSGGECQHHPINPPTNRRSAGCRPPSSASWWRGRSVAGLLLGVTWGHRPSMRSEEDREGNLGGMPVTLYIWLEHFNWCNHQDPKAELDIRPYFTLRATALLLPHFP